MSILRIRDASGNFVAIPSIRGDKGEKGDAGSVTAVNGIAPNGSGNVTLGAADVGARPSNWIPTAADVGALAADGTASDSGRLGGKAPEYYLQPRNLLINSDFLHPVGQAGLGDGVYHGGYLYPADMWREWNAEATHQFDSDTGLTTSEACTFAQLVQIPLNRNYTIALGFSDGSILCANGVLSPSNGISVNGSNGNISMYDMEGATYFTIFFCTNCIWAAIYEGTYTADTLPPYVPKGYGAELLECQRYYRELVVLWGTEMGAPTRQKINYSPRMSIEHPTATFAIDTGASASDAAMTINDVDWERLDFTGTSYGQATITLNAEL